MNNRLLDKGEVTLSNIILSLALIVAVVFGAVIGFDKFVKFDTDRCVYTLDKFVIAHGSQCSQEKPKEDKKQPAVGEQSYDDKQQEKKNNANVEDKDPSLYELAGK